MIDVDLFRKLWCPELFGAITEEHGRWVVKLHETDSSAKLSEVKICGVAPDSVLIKADRCHPAKGLFCDANGQCKHCDYILLTEVDKKKYTLFIELKSATSDRLSRSKICNQFKGAQCMLHYSDAVLSVFHNRDRYLAEFNNYRYVVFYAPAISRGAGVDIRNRTATVNDTPDNFLKYASPRLPNIRDLLGIKGLGDKK